MTLEDFKSYSEEYLASYGNMSRNTQDQKRRGVEKFIRFMESEGRQEIDQKAILAYRKSLLGYSRNTFAQYISRKLWQSYGQSSTLAAAALKSAAWRAERCSRGHVRLAPTSVRRSSSLPSCLRVTILL